MCVWFMIHHNSDLRSSNGLIIVKSSRRKGPKGLPVRSRQAVPLAPLMVLRHHQYSPRIPSGSPHRCRRLQEDRRRKLRTGSFKPRQSNPDVNVLVRPRRLRQLDEAMALQRQKF